MCTARTPVLKALLVFSALTFSVFVARGADKTSWDNLATLRAGRKVEVKKSSETLKGTFLAFTTNSVSIRVKDRDLEIQRTDIRRVRVRSGAARLRHTLLGAAIGAGTAIAIAIPNINEGYAAYGAVAAAVIVMAGATAIGAVIPAYSTLYSIDK